MSIKIFLNIYISGLLILYSSSLSGQSSSGTQKFPLRLEDAISMALRNNKDILIAREGKSRAGQQIREAKSGAFPSISFENGYTRNIKRPSFFLNFGGEVQKIDVGTLNSLQSTVSLNQTLYSGGRTWTAINIAKTFSESIDEAKKFTEKSVILQVKIQYLTILLSKEIVKINKRNFELAEANLKNVKALYERGAAPEFDLLRAEVQVANLQPPVISAENMLQLQMNKLKNLIGMELRREIELAGKLEPQFLEEQSVLESSANPHLARNDYRNLELTKKAFEGNIRIQKASWYPDLDFASDYRFEANADDFSIGEENRSNSLNARLNLKFNIFDGFLTSARVQQASIDVKETEFKLEKMKSDIEIEVIEARQQMEEARKRYDAVKRSVEQAQKAYDIAEVRFKSGQGTQLELFDAQVAMETTQLNSIQSIYDYEVAKAKWMYAIGR